MKVTAVCLIGAAALVIPSLASAHHSFAMFDAEKTLTMKGTVKEFEWTNPHSWLRVTVMDEKTGKPLLWALEMSSPARLTTMGMKANSVKVGDAVSVTFHPMKDGARGGQFIQAVLPGGKQILRRAARLADVELADAAQLHAARPWASCSARAVRHASTGFCWLAASPPAMVLKASTSEPNSSLLCGSTR